MKNQYRFSGAFKDACAEFKTELIALVSDSKGGGDIDEGCVHVVALRPAVLCIDAPTWFRDEVERNMDRYKPLILAFMEWCGVVELRWCCGLLAELEAESVRSYEVSYNELLDMLFKCKHNR